jgi:hypothetical protein
LIRDPEPNLLRLPPSGAVRCERPDGHEPTAEERIMRRRHLLALCAIAVLAVCGWPVLRTGSDIADEAAPARSAAGLIATTGDPDKADTTLPDRPEFSTSGEGLEVEPSPVPGGGVMIDLQGRFQHAATAAVLDSDSVVVECLPDSGAHGGGER